MDYITIPQWLAVKKETRQKLRQIFFIPSTGMVEVVTDEFGKSTVKQDGHTNADLQAITIEKLIDFVGSAAINETIYDLWKRAVEKVENPIKLTIKPEITANIVIEEAMSNPPMITAEHPRKCEKCHFMTGSARGMKIHFAKHNKIKTA